MNDDRTTSFDGASAEEAYAGAIMRRAYMRWSEHAVVKLPEPEIEPLLDRSLPDFVEELLPFRSHPHYLEASDEMRSRILTAGWLMYNEKVVRAECDIVSPLCNDIVLGKYDVPGLLREAMAQALVDEAYHVFIVFRACRISRDQRGLEALRIPPTQTVTALRARQAAEDEAWKRDLLQALASIAVEMSISRYLSVVSNARGIQPLNRVTTALHRRDEAAHAGLFGDVARVLYATLEPRHRRYFERVLPLPWIWFATGDLVVWEPVLEQLGFRHARAMVRDCIDARSGQVFDRALADATSLAGELDIHGVDWVDAVAEAMQSAV